MTSMKWLEMVEHLASENSQCYYNTIPVKSLAMTRQFHGNPMDIRVAWNSTLSFLNPIKKFSAKNISVIVPLAYSLISKIVLMKMLLIMLRMIEEFDEEINQTEQIFDFITVPSFVSLFFGSTIEAFYFVKITWKGVAEDHISDPYGHFILKGRWYFQGF